MRLISMDKLIDYCVKHRCTSVPIDFIKAEKPIKSTLKIVAQLYDPDGCACGEFYQECATIEELIAFLDDISYNGYYSYEIGIDELTRRKNE